MFTSCMFFHRFIKCRIVFARKLHFISAKKFEEKLQMIQPNVAPFKKNTKKPYTFPKTACF